MSLIKSSVWNALAVLIRVITGLVVNKVLAVFVGPSGYAVVGQFQNFVGIGTAFASSGVNNGVTKYTAEEAGAIEPLRPIWSTAFVLSTSFSALISVSVILLRARLAEIFLGDVRYQDLFVWFGLVLPLLVWNGLLLAVVNGLKRLKQYVYINVGGSILGLAVTFWMVVQFGVKGALIALVINQAVVFGLTLLSCSREPWFRVKNFFNGISRPYVRVLLGFVVMALVSSTALPLSQIAIRHFLADQYGWQAAGCWQAVSRISDMYLMLITTGMSFYYLPRLAELRTGEELRREVLKACRVALPLVAIMAAIIYAMRGILTRLLFSEQFAQAEDLFFWQLVGDVMKVGSWMFAYIMLAKAMSARYIVSEICFSFSLIGLTILFTRWFGLSGSVLAFAVNYFLYWVCVYFLCKKVFV
jgi:polysaccharide transporter, PST family